MKNVECFMIVWAYLIINRNGYVILSLDFEGDTHRKTEIRRTNILRGKYDTKPVHTDTHPKARDECHADKKQTNHATYINTDV